MRSVVERFGSRYKKDFNILWTGHILNGNPASASYQEPYYSIITPKATIISEYENKDADRVKRESIHTAMHEISHLLGAPDHYCYNNKNKDEVCRNPDCFFHVHGTNSYPNCIMSEDRFLDLETRRESTIYCPSCLKTISEHLTNHNQ